jgi:threonine dehydrogenase-like Zn-dependent dehydrogenase
MNSLQLQGTGNLCLHNKPVLTPRIKASTARRRNGLTIKVVRHLKHHIYPRAIELVAAGLIEHESLITHHFSLADSAKAFKVTQAKERLKVVIAP